MRILVAGAGGFIGGHLVGRLLAEGHDVRGADIAPPERWWQRHTDAEMFAKCDLRDTHHARRAAWDVDQIYNLACNMGGMGFIGTQKAECMLSVLINSNLIWAARQYEVQRLFFSSSACIYPDALQQVASGVEILEEEAYPADPMDGYGWEKLFSERMCRHAFEDFGLETRVARFDPIYGPHGTWDGGREKVPAAMCRKVAVAKLTGAPEIDVWGDGEQTRTFCYIDDAIDGIRLIMDSDEHDPVNLASAEVVSINQLIDTVSHVAGAAVQRKHIDGPLGARGRQVDTTRLHAFGWNPSVALADGIRRTYEWVESEIVRQGIPGAFA